MTARFVDQKPPSVIHGGYKVLSPTPHRFSGDNTNAPGHHTCGHALRVGVDRLKPTHRSHRARSVAPRPNVTSRRRCHRWRRCTTAPGPRPASCCTRSWPPLAAPLADTSVRADSAVTTRRLRPRSPGGPADRSSATREHTSGLRRSSTPPRTHTHALTHSHARPRQQFHRAGVRSPAAMADLTGTPPCRRSARSSIHRERRRPGQDRWQNGGRRPDCQQASGRTHTGHRMPRHTAFGLGEGRAAHSRGSSCRGHARDRGALGRRHRHGRSAVYRTSTGAAGFGPAPVEP